MKFASAPFLIISQRGAKRRDDGRRLLIEGRGKTVSGPRLHACHMGYWVTPKPFLFRTRQASQGTKWSRSSSPLLSFLSYSFLIDKVSFIVSGRGTAMAASVLGYTHLGVQIIFQPFSLHCCPFYLQSLLSHENRGVMALFGFQPSENALSRLDHTHDTTVREMGTKWMCVFAASTTTQFQVTSS